MCLVLDRDVEYTDSLRSSRGVKVAWMALTAWYSVAWPASTGCYSHMTSAYRVSRGSQCHTTTVNWQCSQQRLLIPTLSTKGPLCTAVESMQVMMGDAICIRRHLLQLMLPVGDVWCAFTAAIYSLVPVANNTTWLPLIWRLSLILIYMSFWWLNLSSWRFFFLIKALFFLEALGPCWLQALVCHSSSLESASSSSAGSGIGKRRTAATPDSWPNSGGGRE